MLEKSTIQRQYTTISTGPTIERFTHNYYPRTTEYDAVYLIQPSLQDLRWCELNGPLVVVGQRGYVGNGESASRAAYKCKTRMFSDKHRNAFVIPPQVSADSILAFIVLQSSNPDQLHSLAWWWVACHDPFRPGVDYKQVEYQEARLKALADTWETEQPNCRGYKAEAIEQYVLTGDLSNIRTLDPKIDEQRLNTLIDAANGYIQEINESKAQFDRFLGR